jgi:hypothetical protein
MCKSCNFFLDVVWSCLGQPINVNKVEIYGYEIEKPKMCGFLEILKTTFLPV